MLKDLRKPDFYVGMASAFILGILIWIVLPLITGQKNAWDSGGDYFLAVLIAGFIPAVIQPRYFWLWPIIVFIGQYAYILPAKGLESLIGIIFMIHYSGDCVTGAVFGAIISMLGRDIRSAFPARAEQSEASVNRYRGLFIVLASVLIAAAGLKLGRSYVAIHSMAAASPAHYPIWINIINVLTAVIFVSPFLFLAAAAAKWARRSQAFTRQQFLCSMSAGLSVFFVYISLRSFPVKNACFSLIYLLSIPLIPLLLRGSYVLYAKVYKEAPQAPFWE